MAYGWWLPGLVTLVVFVLMNLAKDNAPWPIHIGLALAFLGCAGWTIFVHNRDVVARGRGAVTPSRPR